MTGLSRTSPRLALLTLGLLTALGTGCIEQRRPQAKAKAGAQAGTEGAAGGLVLDPDAVDDKLSHLITGERWKVPITADDPAKGAAEPLVTIVEFSDFQCPACKSLVPNLEEAFAKYEDDVRLVFKQFPLAMHPEAEPAARAAMAAGRQGKFWPMHDLLFANQQALKDPDLEKYATQIGLDVAKFKADYADPAIALAVTADRNIGNAMQVNSTPSFFINGRIVKGAVPTERITALIDEEIAMANKLIEAGSKRSEIYARVLKAATMGEAPKPPTPSADPAHKRGEASRVPNYAVPLGEGRPSRGPEDALVTIVEFNDLRCDDCKKVGSVIEKVLRKYPADVRHVFRHAPHDDKESQDLARFAEAAHMQDKFWKVRTALETADQLGNLKDMMTAATAAGADGQQLLASIQNKASADAVSGDVAAVDKFRGSAPAPILFVNGRYLDGVPSFADLDALVAEEKAKAEKFIADTGTKRDANLYETMRRKSNDGKGWRGLSRADEAGAPANDAAAAVAEITTEGLPVKGKADAKVKIVECSDFDCPYCQRSQTTLKQIEETYGDKVAIYFRHNPLPMHPQAEPAHRAAIAAGEQGKFWEMHDKLFADKAARSEEQMAAFAQELGLDVGKWRKAFNSADAAETVKRDLEECRKLGVSGVPAFFVNGESIRGAQPFENFKPLIDKALAG